LVGALAYLHSQNVAHLDIKNENVLLDAEFEPKLADFGYARAFLPGVQVSLIRVGTPQYRPQEQEDSEFAAPDQSDIFGLGMTLLVAATSSYYFPKASASEPNFAPVMNNDPTTFFASCPYLPTDFKDMIFNMICAKPELRWTLKQVQQSQFYRRTPISKREFNSGMKLQREKYSK
jgi:serine/threonine protein kinase